MSRTITIVSVSTNTILTNGCLQASDARLTTKRVVFLLTEEDIVSLAFRFHSSFAKAYGFVSGSARPRLDGLITDNNGYYFHTNAYKAIFKDG